MISRKNLQKHIQYISQKNSFQPFAHNYHISKQALNSTASIRGHNRPPALMIHGIMPRSGTVYVGELLRQHPDIFAFPGEIWEFPFLTLTERLDHLQEDYFEVYGQSREKMGAQDFLPIFGSAMVGHLHSMTPDNQRILMKMPDVQYLSDFYTVFPHEHCLVLIRDGRDVVDSTVRTWRQIQFWMACLRWRRAAKMVIAFHEKHKTQTEGYYLAKFEDILDNPADFVQNAAQKFGFDAAAFPYEGLDALPVKGSSQTKSSGRVNWDPVQKPKNFKPVGRWQKWSKLRKKIFKWIAGDALIKLGYSEDKNW